MTSDAREGDKATVESKENGALSLSSSSVPIPQLNLLSNAPPPADEGHKAVHGGEGHDGGDDEASGRELIGRREAARRADRYSDMAPQVLRHVSHASKVLVSVPRGKRPGDFFSAEVDGRGLMLVEVPEGVHGGDELQMLQMPTEDGEALEWIKYDGSSSKHATHGPRMNDLDRLSAARDSDRRAWSLGNQAPRSYFH